MWKFFHVPRSFVRGPFSAWLGTSAVLGLTCPNILTAVARTIRAEVDSVHFLSEWTNQLRFTHLVTLAPAHLKRTDHYLIDTWAATMITRSARAAQAYRVASVSTDSSSSAASSRQAWGPLDLEEELKSPKPGHYNALREALKTTRKKLEEKTKELEEKDIVLKRRDADLRRCSVSHLAQIQDLQRQVDELKDELKRQQEEMRKRGDSVPPGDQAPKENEQPPRTGTQMLETLRSDIRQFATTYFGNKLQKPLQVRLGVGWAAEFMHATTPGETTYMNYLFSRRRCSLIIEAFIWRFLCGTVFNSAAWGGSEDIRRHVGELQKILSKCR